MNKKRPEAHTVSYNQPVNGLRFDFLKIHVFIRKLL